MRSIADGPTLEIVEVACRHCGGAGSIKYDTLTVKTCPLCLGKQTLRIGQWVWPAKRTKVEVGASAELEDDNEA